MFGFDLVQLVKTAGYVGLFAIIFAESGLFIGFFLPGDSLLFTAGVLASQDYLNIWGLTTLLFFAAALGDSTGYAFGSRIGYKIFYKDDSLFFNKRHIERARAFFEKYGRKAIIIARFLPGIRTFIPILAGVGKMHYATFLSFNIIGALVWAVGVTLAGYFFGEVVPNVDRYLLPVVAAIITVSVLPTLAHLIKDREARANIIKFIRSRGKS